MVCIVIEVFVFSIFRALFTAIAAIFYSAYPVLGHGSRGRST